ncbi:hypothetical protein PHYBOEH_010387 [Phytophthora boehmeriae]|uniref:M96 mating-specific protein family n=1 Tax=Phytophthora boehmeriae TaxID=109152 RepID=A0A8T1VNF7_9STRA|nr:hypothetical protein PHYBOEH_010387 [Phytophthora boehmeriae]
MSFLLDVDEGATLEATLAFVDSWGSTTTDSSSSSSSSPPARCATPQQRQQEKHKSVTKKPRRKYPNSSSTVLQRRKKAEILALRAQVDQLEMQLLQLQKFPTGNSEIQDKKTLFSDEGPFGPLNWADVAARQYQYRLESEKTNQKLKAILANQVKVQDALRTIVQKSSVIQDMDFVWAEPCRPLVEAPNTMEQLARRVERLYLQADEVFPSNQESAISARATVNQNHPFGKALELASTTPMKCSLEKANDTLWNWFSKAKTLRNEPNLLERSYTLELKSDIGTLEFIKQNFVRRYKEANRVVIIWADSLRLPSHGMQFRNETWMLVTRAADDPQNSSVLRTFQQLYMDYQGSNLVKGAAAAAQESAFEVLGNMYRRFMQAQQNDMIEQTRRVTAIPEVSV